jgi:hypothetical protein
MNTLVTHHLIDIVTTACGAINCAPSNSLFHLVQSPQRFNTLTVRGRSDMRVKNVRYSMQPHHLQISGYYSSATSFVKHNNKTLHNNQTPRNNQPSNQLY